jgi:3-hydroxyisobutyrate dehydrogenase-like beta-hydroxyacid dehydrogenase
MTSPLLFVGVGKMGLPMARHLAAAGHAVTAYDADAARRTIAADAGLPLAPDLAAGLAAQRLVVSSLPDDAALDGVSHAIAGHAAPGTVWIDTSTVSPAASRAAAARAGACGVSCLRATVSGNTTMAERAALTSYVSGDRAAYEVHEKLFACWGPQRFYLGPGEEARVAKLVVNLLIVGTSTMLAEALALGEAAGLSRTALWDVIEASAAASPIVRAKAPALRADDYRPTFTVEQMRKDVALIRDAARAVGVAAPVADVAANALERAAAAGAGGEDYAVVIRQARKAALPR